MSKTNTASVARNAPPDIEIALELLGISTEHLVRPLDVQYVSELVETDENEWEAIEVRLWPSDWPKPADEVIYHVISGNHRTSAARIKGLQALRARVIDASDDLSYLLAAIRTNARHGRNFTTGERAELAAKLKAQGLSSSEIARAFGVHKSTVNNLLSGRDTNASRKLIQQAKAQAEDTLANIGDIQELGQDWRSVPTVPADAKRIAKVGQTVNNFLAETPMGEDKGYVMSWIRSLPRETRNSLARDMSETSDWLLNVAMLLKSEAVK